jgi:hypothetical protein
MASSAKAADAETTEKVTIAAKATPVRTEDFIAQLLK